MIRATGLFAADPSHTLVAPWAGALEDCKVLGLCGKATWFGSHITKANTTPGTRLGM
jgi:hypothetical protein